MLTIVIVEWITPIADAGQRLDHHLQSKLPEFSRSRLQAWVRDGLVLVDNRAQKASYNLRGGETISATPAAPPPLHAEAEDLPLHVLYEDSDVVVVNKAAGVVVHAGAGNHSGTLVNALLHRYGALPNVGGAMRPGIVHRLDKDTSGVLVVARTEAAHRSLAAQFSGRTVEKLYTALVQGIPAADTGRIEKPITRDPIRRTRMTCRLAHGRAAITEFEVIQRFTRHTLLEVRIATGRTHQIRVHLASLGHPVFGDTLYGAAAQPRLSRFFLHAAQLRFASPSAGEIVTVAAPLPPELTAIIEAGSL